MSRWRLPLSFALFFQAVCKDNTHIPQYDAVNLLLMGETLTESDPAKPTISSTMTSHYISGSKKISKAISSQFLLLEPEERLRRMNNVLLQDTNAAVNRMLTLLEGGYIEMPPQELRQFTSFSSADQPIEFLTALLTAAIGCPRDKIGKLPSDVIQDIRAMDVRPRGGRPVLEPGDTFAEKNESPKQRARRRAELDRKKKPSELQSRDPDNLNLQPPGRKDIRMTSLEAEDASGRYTPEPDYDYSDYENLNSFPDDSPIDVPPEHLYVLSLYFIGLCYPNEATGGDYYLVLDYGGNFYGTETDPNGVWSVPYTQYHVDTGGREFRTVGEIKEAYNQFFAEYGSVLNLLEDQKLNDLGIKKRVVNYGSEHIKYKWVRSGSSISPSFYYVRSIFLQGADESSIVNLIDPEMFHAHRYLPLAQAELADASHMTFLDKKIPRNIAEVILDREKPIEKWATHVPEALTRRSIQGTMFVISTEQMSNSLFVSTDISIAEDEIVRVFNSVMIRNGISLFNATSRRVVGILPQMIPASVHNKKNFFLLMLSQLLTEFRTITQSQDEPIRLSCTVFSGLYQYDRPLSQPFVQFGGAHYFHLFQMHQETCKINGPGYTSEDSVFIGIKNKDLDLIRDSSRVDCIWDVATGPFNMIYYFYE